MNRPYNLTTRKTCVDCNRELDIENFYTKKNGNPFSCCKQCLKRRHYFSSLSKRKNPIILTKDTERYNKVKDEFMYFVDASENPILNLRATHFWVPKPALPEHPPLTLENCLFGSGKKAKWRCIICDWEWIASIKSRFRPNKRVTDRGRTRGYKISKPSDCPKCKGGVKMTREEWMQKFNNVHNNLYDYSLVREIKNSYDTIPIICPKGHIFKQQVIVHSTKHGCSVCKHKTEKKLLEWFQKQSFIKKAKPQYNPKWCSTEYCCIIKGEPKIRRRQYSYDFLITLQNGKKLIIELDGPQHFEQVSNWQGPLHNQIRDAYKEMKARQHKLKVIRILQEDVYYDRNDWEAILTKKLIFKYLTI